MSINESMSSDKKMLSLVKLVKLFVSCIQKCYLLKKIFGLRPEPRWEAQRPPDPRLQSTSIHRWLRPCYRKRGSASYIVRAVRSVRERERERLRERERERERERARERDGSDVTWNWGWVLHFPLPKICTLVLAKIFAFFLAKNLDLSFSPFEWRWVHTFRCQKRCTLRNSSHSSFCFCQMAWQGIEALKQTIEFPTALSFFSSKKWIKLIPKTIGNKKEIVRGVALGE